MNLVNEYRILLLENLSQWADTVAEMIAVYLIKDLKQQQAATLLLSGGRSPQLYLQKLSHYPLAWDDVTVSLVDERFVPHDPTVSNAAFITENLLQKAAEKARFIPLLMDTDYQKNIDKLNRHLELNDLSYSIVVLGMGDDGHTASLFPQSEHLDEGLYDPVNLYSMQTAPTEPIKRISLNLYALEQAKHIIIAFEGKKKKEIFDMACQKLSKQYPISFVLKNFASKITVICTDL